MRTADHAKWRARGSTAILAESGAHHEIAAIVERLTPAQRLALMEALAAFNEAGGEPLVAALDTAEPHPLGWAVDVPVARDA